MVIIYLDQNKWIRLLQQREGRVPPHEKEIPEVLELVEHSSRKPQVGYVIDWVRHQESAVHGNVESRNMLLEFMVDISGGWCFPPYNIVRDEEIRAAVKRRAGHEVNLLSRILNKGPLHFVGGPNYDIKNEQGDSIFELMSDDELKKFFDVIQSDEAFRLAIADQDLVETSREIHGFDEEDIELLSGWEEDFPEEYSEYKQRRRASHLRHFIFSTGMDYFKYGFNQGLTLQNLSFNLGNYLKRGEKAERAEQRLLEFSSAFAFNELRYRRDQENKPLTDSDIRDLMSLAVAIPYSHIVVCEKHFASIAQQGNLDDKFGTEITSNLSDLFDLIATPEP